MREDEFSKHWSGRAPRERTNAMATQASTLPPAGASKNDPRSTKSLPARLWLQPCGDTLQARLTARILDLVLNTTKFMIHMGQSMYAASRHFDLELSDPRLRSKKVRRRLAACVILRMCACAQSLALGRPLSLDLLPVGIPISVRHHVQLLDDVQEVWEMVIHRFSGLI